jgi:hypothetical protein
MSKKCPNIRAALGVRVASIAGATFALCGPAGDGLLAAARAQTAVDTPPEVKSQGIWEPLCNVWFNWVTPIRNCPAFGATTTQGPYHVEISKPCPGYTKCCLTAPLSVAEGQKLGDKLSMDLKLCDDLTIKFETSLEVTNTVTTAYNNFNCGCIALISSQSYCIYVDETPVTWCNTLQGDVANGKPLLKVYKVPVGAGPVISPYY